MAAPAPGTYHIPDEPRPGPLSYLIVNPIWPLLSVMFVGYWFSILWFLLNAMALGMPNLRRDIITIVLGTALILALGSVFAIPSIRALMPQQLIPYYAVSITVASFAVVYMLYFRQQEAIELYEYFGGTVNSKGFLGLILGRVLDAQLSPGFLALGAPWIFLQ